MKNLKFVKVLVIALVALATLGCGDSNDDFNAGFYNNVYFQGGNANLDGTDIVLAPGQTASLMFDVYDANGTKQTVGFATLRGQGYSLELSGNLGSPVTLDAVNGTVTLGAGAAAGDADQVFLYAPNAVEGSDSISSVRIVSGFTADV